MSTLHDSIDILRRAMVIEGKRLTLRHEAIIERASYDEIGAAAAGQACEGLR